MDTISSQSQEVRSIFKTLLLGSIGIPAIVFVSIFSSLSDSQIQSTTWWTAVLWTSISLMSGFAGMLASQKIHYARTLYILMSTNSIAVFLLLIECSIRLVIASTELTGGFLLGFLLLNLIVGCWAILTQVHITRGKLKAMMGKYVDIGKLNLGVGQWDLKIPLYLDDPEIFNKRAKTVERLAKYSPLVTATGLLFARMVEGRVQTLAIGLACYVMGFVTAWGFTTTLALFFQIKEWETKFKVGIKI